MWSVTTETGEKLPVTIISARAMSVIDQRNTVERLVNSVPKADERLVRLARSVPTWLNANELTEIGLDLAATSGGSNRVIVPGLTGRAESSEIWLEDEVVILYKPSGIARLILRHEEAEVGSPVVDPAGRQLHTFVEWFSTTGDNTIDSSGVAPARQDGVVTRGTAWVGFQSGYVLGRIVRLATRNRGEPPTDPFWTQRLTNLEAKHPQLTERVPQLPDVGALTAPLRAPTDSPRELVVLVHGTISCGMHMAASLYPPETWQSEELASHRVFRFEHDTFLSYETNASELVRRLAPFYGSSVKLLLVGHSRGGLVASSAAVESAQRRLFGGVALRTYGTPHAGTPIVAATQSVARAIEALLKVGTKMGASLLGADALGWVAGHALSQISKFPEGIADMRPGTPLATHRKRDFSSLSEAYSFGAAINPRASNASGFLPAFSLGLRKGFFDPGNNAETPNDGVVPAQSSIAALRGIQPFIENCDHSSYFDRLGDDLRRRISQGLP